MVSLNIDLDKLNMTIKEIENNPSKAKRIIKVEGDWILNEKEPQFRADIATESGTFSLEADQPSFLGGKGSRLGPMHYCVFGLAACYLATFVTLSAMQGVTLKKAKVMAESHMDLSRTLGLSNNPIIAKVKFRIIVDSSVDERKIQELSKLAEERCPAVYCLSNPIQFSSEIIKE